MSSGAPLHFLDTPRRLPRTVPASLRVLHWMETYGDYSPGDTVAQAGRCLDCGNPYCQWGCPLHNAIPRWLELAQAGRLFEAAELAHATNPLPEICGRVCPQDRLCEGACTLETGFEAVTIGALERTLVDDAFRAGWRPDLGAVRKTGRRVAIVGAGPAGLACADRLVRAGIEAWVFDRHAQVGGLLSFGIPPFKLARAVIATRRAVQEAMGVRFVLATEVDAALFATLRRDFDAVFVGTGAERAVEPDFPGRGLPGVLPAMELLPRNARRVWQAEDAPHAAFGLPDLRGKRVRVLGGGDTAMDCVRTAVRLGAAEVACLVRRGEADMPGSRREVASAREEGVAFHFHCAPVAAEGAAAVTGLRVFDAAARAERVLGADVVIVAFGFRPSPPDWLRAAGVTLHGAGDGPGRRGRVLLDGALPQQTAAPRVFAGGDNVRGADLVVNAVRDGREAGDAIAAMLRTA